VVRPVIDNAMRIQVGSFRCAELVSSCALVQNTGRNQAAAVPVTAGQQNNTNIAKAHDVVNVSLAKDLRDMLGGEFFEGIHFNLACPACAEIDKIKALPPGVTTYAPGASAAVPLK
jgi:hypothetical protein